MNRGFVNPKPYYPRPYINPINPIINAMGFQRLRDLRLLREWRVFGWGNEGTLDLQNSSSI